MSCVVVLVVVVVIAARLDAPRGLIVTRERFAKSRTEIEMETTDRTRTVRMSRRLFLPRPRPADDFDDAIAMTAPPSSVHSRFENGAGQNR